MVYLITPDDFDGMFPGHRGEWIYGNNALNPSVLDRILNLAEIQRFSTLSMTHKTNDFVHSMRVNWIVNYMALVSKERNYPIEFDWKKAVALASYHDDTEVIVGDIPSPEKRHANPQKIREFDEQESSAREALAKLYKYAVGDKPYKELLEETKRKETVEAQMVDVADKLDGVGETVHEIRSGNERFAAVLDDYGVVFQEFFDRYKWWQALSSDGYFQMNPFPSQDDARKISLLTKERCTTEKDTVNALFDGADNIHWYKRWLWLTMLRAEHNIVFRNYFAILLPEWYGELSQVWTERRSGWRTRKSGLIVPNE